MMADQGEPRPEQPNPGSDAALKQGCTCPVLDNGRGIGFVVDGERQFWVNGDCPLHSLQAPTPSNREPG